MWAAQVCAVPGGGEVRATGGERAARQQMVCLGTRLAAGQEAG